MGGGICQYADEWYRNWEFDYKPLEKEVVPEEPGEDSQKVPKVPQGPPEGEVAIEQIKGVEGRKSTMTVQTSA